MEVTGKCHCGGVTYRALVDPDNVSVCHCTDCQALTGSPYRVSVPAQSEDFRLLSGRPKIYVKVAESGNRRAQAFCAECGTPIYAAAPDNPPTYNLRVGCLDQRANLPPKKQIWCRSALPWSGDISRVPGLEKDGR